MNNVSHYIDHTNLRQDALQREIMDLCEQGINFDFASVCVNPVHVPLVVSILNIVGDLLLSFSNSFSIFSASSIDKALLAICFLRG